MPANLWGMRRFDECWKRIDRAGTHAKAFVSACNDFLRNDPFEVVPKMRDDRNGVLRVFHKRALDPCLALEIGEYFYQIRAALDAALWRSHILLSGSESDRFANALYFPVHEQASSFDSAAFHKIPLPHQLKSFIRSVQPCFAEEFATDETAQYLRLCLSIIHDRARKDRHRRLNIVGAYLTDSSALIELTPPAILRHSETVPADIFEDGAVCARFEMDGAEPTTKMRVVGKFTAQVAVEDIPAAPDVDVAKQLETLTTAASVVITRFEQYLGSE